MKIVINLIIAIVLSGYAFAKNSLNDAFSIYNSAKVSGKIRVGIINQNEDNGFDGSNSAIGGYLKFETGEINGFSGATAFYLTNRVTHDNDNGIDGLFHHSEDVKSYSVLGEAYIRVHRNNTTLVAGRQQIDTPFADSDDIRMVPNLFEAYVLTNNDVKDTTFIVAHIKKWAGVDAPTQSKFEDLYADGHGTTMLAVVYNGIENIEISTWYYNIDELTDIFYVEGMTEFFLNENLMLSLSAQYANFFEDETTGVDGNVYGVSIDLGIKSVGINLVAAYNGTSNSDRKSVINGFGGGPYMTSMDEMTIDGLNDAKAYVVGISKEYGSFTFFYGYGNFQEGSTMSEVDESDLVAEYSYSDNLNFILMYTDLKSKNAIGFDDDAASFDRVQFYTNYNF